MAVLSEREYHFSIGPTIGQAASCALVFFEPHRVLLMRDWHEILHRMKRFSLLLGVIGLLNVLAAGVNAQTFTPASPAALAARRWREQHERAIVEEFVTLLGIPNIAADRANIQRNAESIAKMMEKRGIAARLVSVPGGNPVAFGEIKTPGAARTIVFYAHYDGQPLDPKEWAT